MRVRGFTQDDAHIFCLPSQLQVRTTDKIHHTSLHEHQNPSGCAGSKQGRHSWVWQDEIAGVLDLVESILSRFGFTEYDVMLSTRPEKSVGTDDIWEAATEALVGKAAGRATGRGRRERGEEAGPQCRCRMACPLMCGGWCRGAASQGLGVRGGRGRGSLLRT